MSEIRVGIAAHAAAKGTGVIVTAGLGSCVAIALHDATASVGALAHVLLPASPTGREVARPAKFADTAVRALLADMRALGADGRIVAKLVGGASMFGTLLPGGGVNVGARNVDASRRALAAAGVDVLAEDVGGEHGRSVSLDLRSGRVAVRTVLHGHVEL
jgi:chemotaxis protein CheD